MWVRGKWENLSADADCWLPGCQRMLRTGENGSFRKPEHPSSKTDAVGQISGVRDSHPCGQNLRRISEHDFRA
jgi:hypothetical protein